MKTLSLEHHMFAINWQNYDYSMIIDNVYKTRWKILQNVSREYMYVILLQIYYQ